MPGFLDEFVEKEIVVEANKVVAEIPAPETAPQPVVEDVAPVEAPATAETDEPADEKPPIPADAPAPVANEVDWTSVASGKFKSAEELENFISATTTKDEQYQDTIRDLTLRLEDQIGLNLSDEAVKFDNLVKLVGADKAPALYGKVLNFKHEDSDPIKTIVAQKIFDDPDLIGYEDELTAQILQSHDVEADSFDDLSGLSKQIIKSEAKKAALSISELQGKLSADSPKSKLENQEAKMTQAKATAEKIISEGLKVKVPGIEDLTIEVPLTSLKRHEAFMSNLIAKYGDGEEQVNHIKQAVSDQVLTEAIKDGSLVNSIKEQLTVSVKEEILKARSNPSIAEDPRKLDAKKLELEEEIKKQKEDFEKGL